MPSHTVAIISVYQENSTLLDRLLCQSGYRTIVETDPYRAYPRIRSERPDLVFLDLWPKYPATGAMLLMLLHLDAVARNIPILVCTADPRIFRDVVMPPLSAMVNVVLKPFDVNHVRLLVQGRINASPIQMDRHAQEVHAQI